MKVAVAVASARVPAWQAAAIAELRSRPELNVRVIEVAGTPWRPAGTPFAFFAGTAVAPAVIALDGGGVDDADIVLDLGDGRLDADAPLGVWSLRLGNDARSPLPFARELAANAGTFEVALLRRRSGRWERLRSGRFGMTRWHPSTVRRALFEAARWPAIVAASAARGMALPAVPVEPPGPCSHLRPLDHLAVLRTLIARFAGAYLENLFEVTEWNVGFARGDARAVIAGEPIDVRWLPAPRPRSFLADPFVVERDGKRVLFAEDYDYDRDRGVIDAFVLGGGDTVLERHRVLDLPTHLSYPFPLELDGELYMIPENCAAGEVAFYRCVEFPARWERERALFPAFDGVDTTLFEHDGRWWAMGTRYSHGSMLSLYAFHAPGPRGPWTAHALNPIVVDIGSARPAGRPFEVDGALYRPAQDCSRTYGGAVVVARIDELTPDAYRETIVRRIDGRDFTHYRDGVHTLNFAADTIVLDGKRTYRDVRKLSWAVRKIRARGGALSKRAVRSVARRAAKAFLLNRA